MRDPIAIAQRKGPGMTGALVRMRNTTAQLKANFAPTVK